MAVSCLYFEVKIETMHWNIYSHHMYLGKREGIFFG
jgi:hypothetical protein